MLRNPTFSSCFFVKNMGWKALKTPTHLFLKLLYNLIPNISRIAREIKPFTPKIQLNTFFKTTRKMTEKIINVGNR